MNLQRCFIGQILSLLSVYKFKSSFNSVIFIVDTFLVPVTCLIFVAYKIRKPNPRSILGGIAGSAAYFFYIMKLSTGSNVLNVKFTLFTNCLGFLIAYVFRFLISGKNNPSFCVVCSYLFLVICTAFIINDGKELTGDRFISSSRDNILSTVMFVLYTVITNIFTNDIGIIEYIAYSSWPFLIIGIFYFKTDVLDVFVKEFKFNIFIYYLVSLIIYIGTICYIQVYGIIYTNYLPLSTLLLYLITKNEYLLVLVPLYVIFIITNLVGIKTDLSM